MFDAPATHVFDIGRFREDTMAFPPSVTIKDFQSEVSQGYSNPKPGGTPAQISDHHSDTLSSSARFPRALLHGEGFRHSCASPPNAFGSTFVGAPPARSPRHSPGLGLLRDCSFCKGDGRIGNRR